MNMLIQGKKAKSFSVLRGIIPFLPPTFAGTAMNPFTDHPASVNETYAEHAGFAFGFGVRMIVGGLACCLHGIFPFLFERTGSRVIISLHQRLAANRRPTTLPERSASAVTPGA
ncbi:MAG: DUF6356 family protein [Burkholderiales bacterium]|nr:DUF6356 family protein [Burkholderiales bacterium]